jgi:hypothetical protein
MRKIDEIHQAGSCLSRAHNTEMVFVLLSRDVAAPATIRFWIQERVRLGKNQPDDLQLLEAETCAQIMEDER